MSSFPCLVCGKTWTGRSRCHCAACHEHFNSIYAFNCHRKDFKCQNPTSRGLVQVNGYWQNPRRALTVRLRGVPTSSATQISNLSKTG